MFWGISPCVDLIEDYENNTQENCPEIFRVLLIGGADSRHVLKTLSKRHRKEKKIKLIFYIMEACIETLAKQLLLLYIAFQPQSEMGLVKKAKLFMELYGNTLVRPSTAKYLAGVAPELIKMLTDYDYLKEIMPNVDIEILYKERDYFENLLKYWCSDDDFDVLKSWDLRLRKSLGVRYDSRVGAFDWDLHMRLHAMGGNQIGGQEYRSFRSNGVAFTWMESEVSKPNRTMACVVVQDGTKMGHYGYLGDMQTGPFVAYGLQCEDEKFLKSTHGQNSYRATDITERNLMEIFHEIEFENNYTHSYANDLQMGLCTLADSDYKVVDQKSVNRKSVTTKVTKPFSLKDVEFKFVTMSQLKLMKCREKYKNMFDAIYFSSTYFKFFDKEIIETIAASSCLLIIENQKYVTTVREKDLFEFSTKISDTVKGMNLRELKFDATKDDFARFIFNYCTKE